MVDGTANCTREMDLSGPDYEDDEVLRAFDQCASQPRPPWSGDTRPANWRFWVRYRSLEEIQRLARWLATTTDSCISIQQEDGEWYFSEEAQQILERLSEVEAESQRFRDEVSARNVEHWLLNQDYYQKNLAEDSSWGRDETGRVYAPPSR